MLYKRKLLCNGIERIRGYHKPVNCMECDVGSSVWCGGHDYLVAIYKSDGKLYIATRNILCTLLKRSLYYKKRTCIF
jgi:hypothetical protein